MLQQPTTNTDYCDVMLTQPHDVTGVHSSYSDFASFLSQPLAPVMEEIEPDVITEIDTNDDSANYECESASGVFQQDKCSETRELTLMVTPGSSVFAEDVCDVTTGGLIEGEREQMRLERFCENLVSSVLFATLRHYNSHCGKDSSAGIKTCMTSHCCALLHDNYICCTARAHPPTRTNDLDGRVDDSPIYQQNDQHQPFFQNGAHTSEGADVTASRCGVITSSISSCCDRSVTREHCASNVGDNTFETRLDNHYEADDNHNSCNIKTSTHSDDQSLSASCHPNPVHREPPICASTESSSSNLKNSSLYSQSSSFDSPERETSLCTFSSMETLSKSSAFYIQTQKLATHSPSPGLNKNEVRLFIQSFLEPTNYLNEPKSPETRADERKTSEFKTVAGARSVTARYEQRHRSETEENNSETEEDGRVIYCHSVPGLTDAVNVSDRHDEFSQEPPPLQLTNTSHKELTLHCAKKTGLNFVVKDGLRAEYNKHPTQQPANPFVVTSALGGVAADLRRGREESEGASKQGKRTANTPRSCSSLNALNRNICSFSPLGFKTTDNHTRKDNMERALKSEHHVIAAAEAVTSHVIKQAQLQVLSERGDVTSGCFVEVS